jgi:hypothetical protein
MTDSNIQQRVAALGVFHLKALHTFRGVPQEFKPWECGLSPSALYNCSLSCRKSMGIKTPEVKWMSIKRWVTMTPGGICLPPGVYLSIKRKEKFVAMPKPHFEKKEFILLMFPYGNVWSQQELDVPISEDWMFSESKSMLILELLMRKDAACPIRGYFKSCHDYMRDNQDQLWIHMKRRRKEITPAESEAT